MKGRLSGVPQHVKLKIWNVRRFPMVHSFLSEIGGVE